MIAPHQPSRRSLMKTLWFGAAAAAALIITGAAWAETEAPPPKPHPRHHAAKPKARPVAPAPAEAPAMSAAELAHAPRMGTWGFDLAGRDPAVAPGQDFYAYANGAYLKAL